MELKRLILGYGTIDEKLEAWFQGDIQKDRTYRCIFHLGNIAVFVKSSFIGTEVEAENNTCENRAR